MKRFIMIILGGVLGLIALAVTSFLILYRVVFHVPELVLPEGEDPAPIIAAWLDDLHERNRFNGIVLLRKDGQTLVRDAWGHWSADQSRELTVETPMRLASVSKAFTVTAILTLADQGRIDIDTPVSTYLPACDLPGITARNLMTHRSGLTDDYMSLADKAEVVDSKAVLDFVCAKEDPFTTTPGEAFAYNNTGYVLLAALVETITDEPFEAFMRRDVFDRLGLSQTRVFNLRSGEGGLAKADTFALYPKPKPRFPLTALDGVAGDGAVFSSLSDLERWADLWRETRVVSPEMHAAALDGGADNYGFGWVVEGDRIWHNGRWLGAQSHLEWHQDRDNVLVVVDNGDGVAMDGIVETLSALLK